MPLALRHSLKFTENLISMIPGSRRFGIPVVFAVLAAPVFVLIAVLVVRAEQQGATETLVRSTEIQNASLAKAMANTHADRVSYLLAFDIGDAPELIPVALDRSGLEDLVRASLTDTNVVNLKLYDGNGVTLFSLDPSHLGQNVSGCGCFAHVLGGETVSELIRSGDPHHSHEHAHSGGHGIGSSTASTPDNHGDAEPRFFPHVTADGDILSTMIRIGVLAPDLVASDGVLEIQSDVTALLATIDSAHDDVVLSVGIPLFVLYVVMVLIVVFVHIVILRREREARLLAEQAAESVAANRAKSGFLSLMSHELRTPLNAIIGFSELIEINEQKNENSENGNYARTIRESGHHMLRQIVSILDMTAIEVGELKLDRVPVDLQEIADAAIQTVQPSYDRSLVTLDATYEKSLPLVPGDSVKLQQVMENLLSNAARFTPAGGEVHMRFGIEPDGQVGFAITDTGVGMTREQIERARLPFDQSWSGMSREADGAGLGLTIADKVVTQLGGSLIIESIKDVGTKILVRLPASEAPRDAMAAE